MDDGGEHYKPFETVYGTETTEKDRPSSQNQTLAAVAEEQQGCKNNVLTAQNVRLIINCRECEKPRCIYSKLRLTPRDSRSLKHTLEKYDYTCGSVVTADGDAMQGKVFVRLQMSCSTPIEFP
ncbi:uncharacterized protein LOC117336468 [Pecten maximus]|uniref:uncharacterized protein LOC117336468 n=1 Tax=Pecten maximus TaxID=6579 RepID=UPI001458CB16|nr:uncharacterized protein LOC117336468 [Pecten maximus]